MAGVTSQLPHSSAQCRGCAFPAKALLAGLKPQGLTAVPAAHPAFDVLGAPTHWPSAQTACTHKQQGSTTFLLGPIEWVA